MPKEIINVCLLKNNIRLHDNPPLVNSCRNRKVLPVFVLDKSKSYGEANMLFKKHALLSLNSSMNQSICIIHSPVEDALKTILTQYEIEGIYTETPYLKQDVLSHLQLEQFARTRKIQVYTYNSSHLWEPGSIELMRKDSIPSFTQYYRYGCLRSAKPRKPLPAPDKIQYARLEQQHSSIESIANEEKWHAPLLSYWDVSENAAINILNCFIERKLSVYKLKRNYPACDGVSRLSPYIQSGLISVNRIWDAVMSSGLSSDKNADHFCSELAWREFSYHLALHHPDIDNLTKHTHGSKIRHTYLVGKKD